MCMCCFFVLMGWLYYPIHIGVTVNTPYSGITILQGDDVTLSCRPSQSDIALQWSYNDSDISSSSYYQFTPPFLNHDLTIIHAEDIDSGNYICAFKLSNEVIDQQSITLTVVPSEYDYIIIFCKYVTIDYLLFFIH